jgi:hypothetical protein
MQLLSRRLSRELRLLSRLLCRELRLLSRLLNRLLSRGLTRLLRGLR